MTWKTRVASTTFKQVKVLFVNLKTVWRGLIMVQWCWYFSTSLAWSDWNYCSPLNEMLVHHKYPQLKHFGSQVALTDKGTIGTVRMKCNHLPKNTTQKLQPGLNLVGLILLTLTIKLFCYMPWNRLGCGKIISDNLILVNTGFEAIQKNYSDCLSHI